MTITNEKITFPSRVIVVSLTAPINELINFCKSINVAAPVYAMAIEVCWKCYYLFCFKDKY